MTFFLDNDVPDRVLRREGHSVVRLREAISNRSKDSVALRYAFEHEMILITCNRQDYLGLCATMEHYGVIIMKRREHRSDEAASVLRLIRQAGESGLVRNINFA